MDAAIAALICTSVMNPQSSGLGGGVVFTIYNASKGMGQPRLPCRHAAAMENSESFMFSQSNFLNTKAAFSDHKLFLTQTSITGSASSFCSKNMAGGQGALDVK